MTAAPAGLVAQLASAEALRRAWVEVQANDAEDGELAPSVRRFAGDVDANLARLSSELTGGEYRPRALTEVMVTTGSGKQRALHVPVAEDRIVERAALDVLTLLVDPHLAPSSYGYRPGLGVGDAVRALVGLRAEGLGWVARADIDDCFPSIDRHRVLYRLGELVPDEGLVGLVTSLLMRPVRTSWGLARPDRGLPQGSPLSPLLSNVVLDRFDRAVLADGFPLVRYGDDMVIAAESSDEAHTALVAAGDAADDVGLRLGEDKSEVASFEEGFFFLGEEFNGRYPPDDRRLGAMSPTGARSMSVSRAPGCVSPRAGCSSSGTTPSCCRCLRAKSPGWSWPVRSACQPVPGRGRCTRRSTSCSCPAGVRSSAGSTAAACATCSSDAPSTPPRATTSGASRSGAG